MTFSAQLKNDRERTTCKIFQIIRKYLFRKLEVEVSQLGWVNSRNKLEGQKKSPWNSGERKAKEMCEGVGRRGRARHRCPPKKKNAPTCEILKLPFGTDKH